MFAVRWMRWRRSELQPSQRLLQLGMCSKRRNQRLCGSRVLQSNRGTVRDACRLLLWTLRGESVPCPGSSSSFWLFARRGTVRECQ